MEENEHIGETDLRTSEVPHRPKRSRRRMPETKVPPAPVIAIKVETEVWEKALGLSGGDPRRLEVRGPTEVIVWNSYEQARRLRH